MHINIVNFIVLMLNKLIAISTNLCYTTVQIIKPSKLGGVNIIMLDFFLVLGQVPGTHFYLTFNELFSAYSICIISYVTRREYRIAIKGRQFIPTNFFTVVSTPMRGRPPKYFRTALISRLKLFNPSAAVRLTQHPKFSYLVFTWKLSIIIFNSLVYESRIIRANLERHNRLSV
jgi:hypothetical protein